MNARELVSDLRLLGPQDQNVIFAFIADRAYLLRLNSGGRLSDLTDFKLFLDELSAAWRFADFKEAVPPPIDRKPLGHWEVEDVCVRCGHVHEGSAQCGVPIGEGRFCRCEVEVSV